MLGWHRTLSASGSADRRYRRDDERQLQSFERVGCRNPRQGFDLRFNIYQPITGDRFSMSYDQFWDGMLDILGSTRIVTISDSLVNALIKFSPPVRRFTLRQNQYPHAARPPGITCTYWPQTNGSGRLDLEKLFESGPAILAKKDFAQARHIPVECQSCVC